MDCKSFLRVISFPNKEILALYDRPDSVALQKDLDFLFEEVLNRMVAPIPYWRIMPFLPQARRVKSGKFIENSIVITNLNCGI